VKHYGDITKISGYDVPIVDIVTGGSPCQDLSVAGKREGLKGERSGLFMEQIRIIKEMREHDGQLSTDGIIRPRFMVWENVPGAFSSNKGYDFKAVLEETAKIADEDAVIPEPTKDKNGKLKWSTSGCIMGDGWSIAWRVHDAQFWGVPQRRKRIALVADFGGETAPEILFERKSLSRDIEESGEARKGTTTDAERGIGETSRAVSFQERAGKPGGGKGILIQDERTGALSTLNNQSVVYGISAYDSNAMKSSNPHSGVYEADTTRTLDLNGGSPACNQGGMMVVQGFDSYNLAETGQVGRCLSAAGGGLNEHTPVVCIEGNSTEHHAVAYRGDAITSPVNASNPQPGDPCHTLTDDSRNYVVIENHPADSRVKISEDGMVQTLSSRMGTGGGNVPMVMEPVCVGNGQLAQARLSDKVGALNCMHDQQAVITYGLDRASYNQGMNAQYDFRVEEEKIGTQVAKGPGAVCQSVVRRLTPLEAERLQGFPDGWTDIGEWYDSKGKKHKDADSPRYKALGNSIALPFWQYLADKMCAYLNEPTMASLFDGIGGFPLVFSRAGCKPVFASEVEEFPIAVTKRRFPDEVRDDD
jgi:DNA (cytosine-5)-methyltransferase 1